ncbi:MAG: hypothetical protein JSU85_06840 [Candidatus Zixiibacteriota bacterium]|nr:MAG: hypothetical protein JSU85_06840 [candidate division Zixibacteria bacterium]
MPDQGRHDMKVVGWGFIAQHNDCIGPTIDTGDGGKDGALKVLRLLRES